MIINKPNQLERIGLANDQEHSDSIYPPNHDDQSPINENAQHSPKIPINGKRRSHPDKSRNKFNMCVQIGFWLLVVSLVFGIGYYFVDNIEQGMQIKTIIDKIKAAQNYQKPTEYQKQVKKDDNASNTNSKIKEKVPTENLMIYNALTEQDIGKDLNLQSHRQIKLKSFLFDEIPKRIWHFSSKPLKISSLWTQKCYQQHKRMAGEAGYQFLTVNLSDFGRYLSYQRFNIIKQTMMKINARYHSRLEPWLIRYRDLLVKQLINLQILIENGGVFIDEDIILTESITWIEKIMDNQFVNAKQFMKKPLLIGFHSVDFSSQLQYYQLLPSDIAAEKYFVRYPSISSYFLAATKNNQFLIGLRDNFYQLLQSPIQIEKYIEQYKIRTSGLKDKISFYQNIFEVSAQLLLRAKQKELKKTQAIKFYQLATISQKFGPNKIKTYLGEENEDKIFNHLTRMTRSELQYEFGPMIHMLKIQPKEEIYVLFQKYIKENKIIQKSLIHETLLMSENSDFIEHIGKEVSSRDRWSDLPSKLWIYSNQKSYQTSLFNQMWLENTKKIAELSNFELIILNDSNIRQYLSKQILSRIEDALDQKKIKIKKYDDTRMHLISLAILYENGGVWVSPQTFLTDNLSWLHNINQEPYLWNKYGKNPKVILTFQPHYGSPFDWKYKQFGIKQSWHLAYQNTFIAASPKSVLIKDWLNQIIVDLGIPFADLIPKFYQCQTNNYRWTNENNQQMLAQDCIKCILGRKKVQLANEGKTISPNEYYGLWAINGYTGYLKMREYTCFMTSRNMHNPLVWRYSFSEMQKIAGNVHHMARIYKYTSQYIQEIYETKIKSLVKQFHPQSFMMTILSSFNGKIVLKNKRLYLQSQYEKYITQLKEKQQQQNQLSHVAQIMWIYDGGEIDVHDDFFRKNIMENIRYYAGMSQFDVRIVSRENYTKILKETKQDVDSYIKKLKQKSQKQQSNLKDHFENIIGYYISLCLLQQFGGIAVNKKLVLHENLNWLKNISKQRLINKGGVSKPKVFGFFAPEYSPKKQFNKYTKQQTVMYPSLDSYFIASIKKTEFIKDMRQQFKTVTFQNQKCKDRMKKIGHSAGWLHGDDPYYESFFLASHFVISQKNKQLSDRKISQNALDYYGLYTLNTRYYTYKMNFFVNTMQINDENLNHYLARTPLAEVQKQMGQLRYFSVIPKYNSIRYYVYKSESAVKGFEIMKKSFLHQFLTQQGQKKGIIQNQGDNVKWQSKEWSTLPQEVWVYNQKGIKSSDFMTQLMFIQINKTFTSVGYKVHDVDENSIGKYLENNISVKIKKVLQNKNNAIHKEYLIRLALIQKYGGVSILLNNLITEKPSWIKNISFIHNELIFNRFGANPKVLLFVDALRNSNKWRYAERTKVEHVLGWMDGFIAAQKDNQLIREWLNMFIEYLQGDSKKQEKILTDCQLKQNKKSKTQTNQLGLDILQCVINNRHIKLQKETNKKEVCNYYGLWGISQNLGLSKLEDQFNVDIIENDLNPLFWKWSQSNAEMVIGKFNFMTRLNNKQLYLIQKVINKYKLKAWQREDSLLFNTLYKSTIQKLIEKDGKIVIKQ